MKNLKSRVAKVSASLAMAALPLLFNGCASTSVKPKVPGIENNIHVTDNDVVPLSQVIDAINQELASVFTGIEEIKKVHAKNPAVKGLTPQNGNAVFSGTIQTVRTDSGNVAAVIPFSGYADTTLGPKLERSKAATSEHTTTLEFSFKSAVNQTNLPQSTINTGGFIRDNLLATFEQMASTSYNEATGESYDPQFTNRKLTLTTTFSLVRESAAGLGVKFTSPAPDLNTLESAPAFGVKDTQKGTYKLTVNIPLIEPDPNSTKRIVSGLFNPLNGQVYLIDRPFDSEFHKTNAIPGVVNIFGGTGNPFIGPNAYIGPNPLIAPPTVDTNTPPAKPFNYGVEKEFSY